MIRPRQVLTALAGALVLALVLGQVLGQPILLGYVTSGSMEPTIGAGDGFVAIPAQLTGSPGPGDVVVFETAGGELTTHRVVESTDRGYVTRGDANPFTDQDGGDPHVQEGDVVARALQLEGWVVTVPHLGTAVEAASGLIQRLQFEVATTLGVPQVLGASGLALLICVACLALYGLEVVRGRHTRGRSRPATPITPTRLVGLLTVLVVTAALAAMVVPAGGQTYDVVSAEFDSERPLVIERGQSETVAHPVSNTGAVPVLTLLETDRASASVQPERLSVGAFTDREATVALTAPPETGYYPATVTEYRYLLVLPPSLIERLHAVHPGLPVAVILALLGASTYAVGRLAVGGSSPRTDRRRARSRLRSP